MRRSAFLAAAAASAVLAGCGIGAPDYPDFTETSYRIEGMTTPTDGGASTRTVIYRDGPQMRVEAVLPNYGQAAVVFDESTNAAYVLNPTQGMTTVQPTATPDQTAATATTPTTPGATTTAPAAAPPTSTAAVTTGVAVRLADADAPQPLETAWDALGEENARSVGRCQVAGEDGHEWRAREGAASGVERTACITDDGIVLRIRENERVLWEATSLQRGDQPDAMFGVPAGYQLIDPQAVADQVGENLDELDSVTGDAPAQQPAAPPRG